MKRTKNSGIPGGEPCKVKREIPKGPGQPAYLITKEVLSMVERGLTKAEMAKELNVSESSIQRRLSKLQISLRQNRSSNKKRSDSTGLNSVVQGQEALTVRMMKGVQNTTEQEYVASELAVTSAQGIFKSTDVVTGPNCLPTEALAKSHGQISKSRRITAAHFQGKLTDIHGENYTDVDLQNDSTVEKGLVSGLFLRIPSLQNVGHADKAQHVIMPGGARVEVGGGVVAECGIGEGYNIGQAVDSPHESEAAFDIPVQSGKSHAGVSETKCIVNDSLGKNETMGVSEAMPKTESTGILDESSGLKYPFPECVSELQVEMNNIQYSSPETIQALEDAVFPLLHPFSDSSEPQTVADEGKSGCPSIQTQTEMPLNPLAFVPNPETVQKKIKVNAVAPTTVPLGLSDDRKPVVLSTQDDGCDWQHSGMANPGVSPPRKQGSLFNGQDGVITPAQPEQDEDMTDPESAELLLDFSGQETVDFVSSGDIKIRELGQALEPAEYEQDHSESGVQSMGLLDQQDFGQKLALSGVAGHASLLIEHPPELGDRQAVAGQSQGNNGAGEAFQTKRIVSGQPGHEQELGLDFSGSDELAPMVDSDLIPEPWQVSGVLDREGVSQIVGSREGRVEQQMLNQGVVQNEAEYIEWAVQPVDWGLDLILQQTCDQFLNGARQKGVERDSGGNMPRFDMI